MQFGPKLIDDGSGTLQLVKRTHAAPGIVLGGELGQDGWIGIDRLGHDLHGYFGVGDGIGQPLLFEDFGGRSAQCSGGLLLLAAEGVELVG